MNQVLVLGGAGYIGSHVCKFLRREGYTPVTIDNFCTGHREFVKWGPHFEVDIKDRGHLLATFKRVKFDAVIHLAAHIEVGESVRDPDKYFNNNVGGTENVLSVLEELDLRVPFIFSSTAAVYGQPNVDLIPESTPLQPINPYGESKKQAEERVVAWSKKNGAPSALLRYFNVAGADPEGETGEAHDPETHLIPRLLLSFLNSSEFKIFGDDYPTPDGTCIRDYVHVWDLAGAHFAVLNYLNENSGLNTFNIGYSQGVSVREIILAAEKVCQKKILPIVTARRAGDPAVLVADARRAIQELNWTPQYMNSLEQIIAHAWNWHKSNP